MRIGERSALAKADHGRDHAAVVAFRRARALLETPGALHWVALTFLLMGLLNYLLGFIHLRTLLQHLVVAALAAGAAWVIRTARVRPAVAPVITGVVVVAACLDFQLVFNYDPDALGLAYVLICMVAAGPFILDPRVFTAVAVCTLIGFALLCLDSPHVLTPSRPADWIMAAITAQIMAAVLMYIRLHGIDELGRATRLAEDLAEHDRLTGLLNRHGMERAMPNILARARKTHQPVFALFVDVDGLKLANDLHGHEFGDVVIQVAAAAVRASADSGSAVARWGGDEFLVLGVGAPQEDALTASLHEHVRASGIDLEKWPGRLGTGLAVAAAQELEVERLIGSADHRMYDRRRLARRHDS